MQSSMPDGPGDEVVIDRPCVTCGHDGNQHRMLETEEPGRTRYQTFCEECDAPCEYVPSPEA